eukprot:m.89709 g.89709  ORF g.89709 m.89709 type:complete len:239 (+) comp13669_c1_seq1:241-957(+)
MDGTFGVYHTPTGPVYGRIRMTVVVRPTVQAPAPPPPPPVAAPVQRAAPPVLVRLDPERMMAEAIANALISMRRLAAFTLDYIQVIMSCMVLTISDEALETMAFPKRFDLETIHLAFVEASDFLAFFVLALFLYEVVAVLVTGRTFGHYLLGVRVVSARENAPISLYSAVARAAVKMLVMVMVGPLLTLLIPPSALPFEVPASTLIAAALIVFSSLGLFLHTHRALHDWAAGTRVVRA